jgi:integrase
MRDGPEIIEYEYSGVLASICRAFVAVKRGVGYNYNTEARQLSIFSRFTLNYALPANTLTETVVRAWITKKPTESDTTYHGRFSLIKSFAEYMRRMGYSAYIPLSDEIGKRQKTFVPHIFTHDEIRRFFTVTDEMKFLHHSTAPRRHLIMPVLFRMLYCCGLRISEATRLQGEDIDLQSGVLTIRKSKFDKSRYVPMSDELTAICVNYAKTRLVGESGKDWFFASPDGGHYCEQRIYATFRELLWKAGISHGGKGEGPRVHDFRHTFAVHCLQKWVANGMDLTTALPRLREYLGHVDFSATEQYLRMTAEVYPEISTLMQEKYGYVIPRERANPYEDN